MHINQRPTRTIQPNADGTVAILDQTQLPHCVQWKTLVTLADACEAIAVMRVRGAPLIGVTAAYGLALALRADASDSALVHAAADLIATRPTAVNLRWAVERVSARVACLPLPQRAAAAWAFCAELAEADVVCNQAIGQQGLAVLRGLAKIGRPLRLMTHCNAGWLATVDWGTALAPVYAAQAAGVDVFVWVSETRPRNQGASLTAFELAEQGIPHALLADNAAGHLMQKGEVDAVIVGADRIAANGDVCNKIGTYLKALAARESDIPFFVAAPGSTIDWRLADGTGIPIEERAAGEVTHLPGVLAHGIVDTVCLTHARCAAVNPAFDVTPAALVTGGIITERGVCASAALRHLFAQR